MTECCKYAYDKTQEKHSLAYYLGGAASAGDDKRMVLQRTIGYINECCLIDYNYLEKRGWQYSAWLDYRRWCILL